MNRDPHAEANRHGLCGDCFADWWRRERGTVADGVERVGRYRYCEIHAGRRNRGEPPEPPGRFADARPEPESRPIEAPPTAPVAPLAVDRRAPVCDRLRRRALIEAWARRRHADARA